MTKARLNLGSFGLKNDSRIVQLSNFEKTVYKGIFNVTREVDYLKQLEKAIIKKNGWISIKPKNLKQPSGSIS